MKTVVFFILLASSFQAQSSYIRNDPPSIKKMRLTLGAIKRNTTQEYQKPLNFVEKIYCSRAASETLNELGISSLSRVVSSLATVKVLTFSHSQRVVFFKLILLLYSSYHYLFLFLDTSFLNNHALIRRAILEVTNELEDAAVFLDAAICYNAVSLPCVSAAFKEKKLQSEYYTYLGRVWRFSSKLAEHVGIDRLDKFLFRMVPGLFATQSFLFFILSFAFKLANEPVGVKERLAFCLLFASRVVSIVASLSIHDLLAIEKLFNYLSMLDGGGLRLEQARIALERADKYLAEIYSLQAQRAENPCNLFCK